MGECRRTERIECVKFRKMIEVVFKDLPIEIHLFIARAEKQEVEEMKDRDTYTLVVEEGEQDTRNRSQNTTTSEEI